MHRIKIPQSAIDLVMSRRGKLHVFSDIDPARTAHVVVDMQNGFVSPDFPATIAEAREIVPNINRISAALRAIGGTVVYLQNAIDAQSHATWTTWYDKITGEKRAKRMDETFGIGSKGHELWHLLDVQPQDLKVNKTRFSAFVPGASDLHAILQARGIDTVIITGTSTNVCCDSTARDAMMLNYQVIFVSDGTAAYTDDEHNITLSTMLQQFADVMSTDELVGFMQKPAARSAAE